MPSCASLSVCGICWASLATGVSWPLMWLPSGPERTLWVDRLTYGAQRTASRSNWHYTAKKKEKKRKEKKKNPSNGLHIMTQRRPGPFLIMGAYLTISKRGNSAAWCLLFCFILNDRFYAKDRQISAPHPPPHCLHLVVFCKIVMFYRWSSLVVEEST